jgi:type VI secretion system protein ImpA
MAMLDAVCAFLERTEPTNPAPLLIRRARALMGKDFIAIMQDLAPDSLAQIHQIVGKEPE